VAVFGWDDVRAAVALIAALTNRERARVQCTRHLSAPQMFAGAAEL
jgi:hypothetical protein